MSNFGRTLPRPNKAKGRELFLPTIQKLPYDATGKYRQAMLFHFSTVHVAHGVHTTLAVESDTGPSILAIVAAVDLPASCQLVVK